MFPAMNTRKNIGLALYQPDIPQNVGAAMRLCACLGMDLHIIEPCGFPWKEKEFKRIGMDYIALVTCHRHISWDAFLEKHKGRIILMTTKAATDYLDYDFQDGDVLLAGRESVGVPEDVHAVADGRVKITMHGQARSMNVINACAMIAGEALRQLR